MRLSKVVHLPLIIYQLCMELSANTRLLQNRQVTRVLRVKGSFSRPNLSFHWKMSMTSRQNLIQEPVLMFLETSTGKWQLTLPRQPLWWWQHSTQSNPDLSAVKITYSQSQRISQNTGGGKKKKIKFNSHLPTCEQKTYTNRKNKQTKKKIHSSNIIQYLQTYSEDK